MATDTGLDAGPVPPAPDPVPPSLGPLGWLRWAWRQLTSMRTALLLLMLLAVAAVPGSVFPQRRIDPSAVQGYLAEHPGSGPWLDRLGAFDVYTSPWFSAVYLLLFVSLVGCVLPRTAVHARALRSRPPRTPRNLDRLPAHGTRPAVAGPQEVVAAAQAALRRRRYRVAVHDDGASVAAERGYLRESGNLVFHLALVGLLVSVAASSFLGYSGQALVVTGGTFTNVIPQYDDVQLGTRVDPAKLPPFSFTLDDLRVVFDAQSSGSQFGAPRAFDGTVTVRDAPGDPPRTRTLRVNEPLDVAGTRVFLVGNGYAPVVTVRDGNGDVAFSGPVPFLPRDANYTSLGVVKVPDARPEGIGLQGFLLPTAVLDPARGPISVFPDATDPRLVLTAFVGDLGMDALPPQSVYQLDTSRMTQLLQPRAGVPRAQWQPVRLLIAPGDSVTLPDGQGSVTFEGLRRYAALDIRYDPTKGWVLVFALLALTGVTLSLFVRRRRLWVRATPDGGGRTVVVVAGLARGEDDGLAAEVGAVLDLLAPGGDVPPAQRQVGPPA